MTTRPCSQLAIDRVGRLECAVDDWACLGGNLLHLSTTNSSVQVRRHPDKLSGMLLYSRHQSAKPCWLALHSPAPLLYIAVCENPLVSEPQHSQAFNHKVITEIDTSIHALVYRLAVHLGPTLYIRWRPPSRLQSLVLKCWFIVSHGVPAAASPSWTITTSGGHLSRWAEQKYAKCFEISQIHGFGKPKPGHLFFR